MSLCSKQYLDFLLHGVSHFLKKQRKTFLDGLETADWACIWSAEAQICATRPDSTQNYGSMSTSDSYHRQKIHYNLPKPLPGQGTEQGNCSTLSFDGSSPHNAFSTGLDVAETDPSCTTHVRLRTCNPSPHCPPYRMVKGNRGTHQWH